MTSGVSRPELLAPLEQRVAALAEAANETAAFVTTDSLPDVLAIPDVSPKIPGYEILGELGRGGMGVVYKVRHIKLNRPVHLRHEPGPASAQVRRCGPRSGAAEGPCA